MFAENRIIHLQHPKKLCLAWNERGIKRFTVGELVNTGETVTLKYFPESDDFKQATAKGFVPLTAFNNTNHEYSSNVMDYFMSRITSRKRSDFDLYLETLGIDPADKCNISDFTLLGYGEGRLPSDGYHVVNDYSEATPPVEFVTEIASIQYGSFIRRMEQVEINMSVTFQPEPDNAADPNAVRIDMNGDKLGYVNRIQAPAVKKWIETGYTITGNIFRKNGLPSQPRVFIFLSVR